MAKPTIKTRSAKVLNEETSAAPKGAADADKFEPLALWVVAQCDKWRTWRDSVYQQKFNEYERLWRGIWSTEERLRESERSRIVAPALSEAVENGAAEIEEAVFGRGAEFFDLQPYGLEPREPKEAEQEEMPGAQHPMPDGSMMPGAQHPGMLAVAPEEEEDAEERLRQDVDKVRQHLKEDLGRVDFASECAKAIVYSGVFGTGIGEIIVKQYRSKKPRVRLDGPGLVRDDTEYALSGLRAVSPRNFLVDPNASCLDDALGCAIEEEVSKHLVQRAQKDGVYRKDVNPFQGPVDQGDPNLSGDQVAETSRYTEGKIHQLKYYGLVPKKLLYPEVADEKVVDLFPSNKQVDGEDQQPYDDGEYVEAIVVVTNKSVCVKADPNPYTMQDRPVVIFPWDIVPGRLHGRGLCEKGASSQKILDAEIRARLDSLAYTTAPMMGMDVNRVPRGAKFIIKPGHTFLTNGKPSDVMEPFKFGQLDPNHWQNAQALAGMVQQATGSLDAAQLAQSASNARPGAVSLMMAPVIKRYKRTLIHFVDLFLMPAIEKIALRNMQYVPERYPSVPLHFRATSTIGLMQRAQETAELGGLLNSMDPATPEHRAILMGIVSNTTIPNREKVLELIENAEKREKIALAMAAMQQADPRAEQLRSVSIELEIQEKQAKIAKLQSEATLNQAKAQETAQSAEVNAMEVAAKGIYAVPAEQQKAEWDRRYKMMQLALSHAGIQEKRADRVSNERITAAQLHASDVQNRRKVAADLLKARQQQNRSAE